MEVSRLSVDCTLISHQRWDVIDRDLMCGRFSLPSSFRLGLHLPIPARRRVLSTRLFLTTCGLRVLDVYRLQDDSIDGTFMEICARFRTDPEMCALCTSTRLYTFTNTHSRSLALSLSHLCCFMCSAVVHIEHKQVRSDIAVQFGLKLRRQSATQRFLFKTCDGCYSSGFA